MGPNAQQEVALKREIGMARIVACIYWITIASFCFLGAVKPLFVCKLFTGATYGRLYDCHRRYSRTR